MAHLTDPPRFDLDVSGLAARSGGGWQLTETTGDSWAWAEVLTPEECDSVIEIGRRANLYRATTGEPQGASRRNSSVAFLFPSDETKWLFERLTAAITATNQYFGFDLTHMMEGIQFTEYRAPGQNYGWHVDMGGMMAVRKLSLTIQLTDPDDYEGGELELKPEGEIITANKKRGHAVAFPSYTLHRVTPVTRGTRHSLVVWVTGPPFR